MSGRSNTTKVFVGSLPAGTTIQELRGLFAPYGTIAECDVVNRCGFVHLEDKHLAFRAIDELNNFHFKGSRLTVEKGRVKHSSSTRSAASRNQYQNQRHGFSGGGGPIRGNRDFNRGAPYEQRGPMPRRDNYDSRPPLLRNMMGPGPRRPYIHEHNNRYSNEYEDNSYNRHTSGERNNNYLMDAQVPPINTYNNRQPQPDVYNRRDIPSKPMGGYNNTPHNSDYGLAYPPFQEPRGFVGDSGPYRRRDTSLRRY